MSNDEVTITQNEVGALPQAISEMRNMRESYDQIGAAAEAYNTGKVQLAQNITSKGVPASASETLPELAEKVSAIAQESYVIQGGEMYAKQLFGSLETPNYWNLYDILAQLLSDGRLVNYGGILLAEYYRGYDSLALSGAGSGGAYVVSDLDENGQFKMYTEDTTHTWATEFDGKGNRWVAYCFADAGHGFSITNTGTCPRSIFIGRHVGVIECIVKGRISEIVVPDGNLLDDFRTWTGASGGSEPQNFSGKVVIRGIKNHSNGVLFYNLPNVESVYIGADKISARVMFAGPGSGSPLNSMFIECNELTGEIFSWYGNPLTNFKNLYIKARKISSSREFFYVNGAFVSNLENLYLFGAEDVLFSSRMGVHPIKYVFIGYDTNDKSLSVTLGGDMFDNVTDVELLNGWCKPLSLVNDNGVFPSLTEENIYAHILQRLKQDEPDCGDGVTITLGSTNLAKLTSAESVQLLDDLTNIYGYTFA